MGIWVWHTSRARLTWDLLGQAEERNADPNFLRQVVLQESLRKKQIKTRGRATAGGHALWVLVRVGSSGSAVWLCMALMARHVAALPAIQGSH